MSADTHGPRPTPDDSEFESVRLERVAQYRIEGVVAQGGEGIVYRATDETLHRTVALKVIGDTAFAERLITEARHTSKLSHPGIAAVYQAGLDDESGCAFVAFEWVEGSTLRSHLHGRAAGRDELLRLTESIAAAVAYAHEQGLVHGDLKADNVVLTVGESNVKLIDFGLSTRVEDLGDDEIWGTPAYMAPELFEGIPRSVATDLFALGVLLFEISTGQLPFGGADGDESKVRRAHGAGASDVRDHEPDLPVPFAEIVQSLLSLDPARRGPTATEVSRWAHHARQSGSKNKGRIAMAVVLVVLAAVGAFVFPEFFAGATDPERGGGGASTTQVAGEVERVEVMIEVGEWSGPADQAETTEDFADLLRMLLHGDDPGSALLHGEAGSTPPATEDDGDDLDRWRIDGTWRREEDGYIAEVEVVGEALDIPTRRTIRAVEPVALAEAIVDGILAPGSVEEDTPTSADGGANPGAIAHRRNARAATLASDWTAVTTFIRGVRACEGDELTTALDYFERSIQAAGQFPEANAWRAAVHVAQGDIAAAVEISTLLRDRPSHLCRVLGDTLATPVRNRRSRWGKDHRLAHRFDLTLDVADPATGDQSLLGQIARVGERGGSHVELRALELAVRYGDRARADDAIERLRTFGRPSHQWRVIYFDWRLEQPDDPVFPPAGWMLRLRPPSDFLQIPYFLHDGDLDSALHRAGESLDVPTAQIAGAVTLAIGGRFEEALAIAGRLSLPLDRGLGDRLRAGIAMLAGDRDAAVVALNSARDHDPNHPKTLFLLEYIATEPFDLVGAEVEEVSDYTRWRQGFLGLAEARRAAEPADAKRILGGLRWVDDEFRVIDWPEIGYLRWLEQIRLTAVDGDRAGALRELKELRSWWPKDRTPSSRVSKAAKRLEVEIEGAQ